MKKKDHRWPRDRRRSLVLNAAIAPVVMAAADVPRGRGPHVRRAMFAIVVVLVSVIAPLAARAQTVTSFVPLSSAGGATEQTWTLRMGGGMPLGTRLRLTAPGADFDLSCGELYNITRDRQEGNGCGSDEIVEAVVGVDDIPAGDEILWSITRVTNPPAGTDFDSILVEEFDSEGNPTGSSGVPGGEFTAPHGVSLLRFMASPRAANAEHSIWSLQFKTSSTGAMSGGCCQVVTVTGPPGTQFEENNTFVRAVNLKSGADLHATIRGNTLRDAGRTIDVQLQNVHAGDEVAVQIAGVDNPPSGGFADLAISTSSDPTIVNPSSGLAFEPTSALGEPVVQFSSAQGSASATWTALISPSAVGAIPGHFGPIQDVLPWLRLTAPTGTTLPPTFGSAKVINLDTGDVRNVQVTTDGLTTDIPVPVAVAPGERLAVMLPDVVNPPGGISAGAVLVSTSSQTTPAAGNALGNVSRGPAPANLRVRASSAAGGALGVTWSALFRTSRTGAIAPDGSITFTAPPGTDLFPDSSCVPVNDSAFYALNLSTGEYRNCFFGSGVTELDGGRTVRFSGQGLPTVGAGHLVAIGVRPGTNPAPAAFPANEIALSTSSDTVAAHPGLGITIVPREVTGGPVLRRGAPAGGAVTPWVMQWRVGTRGSVPASSGSVTATVPAGATLPAQDCGGSQYALLNLTTGSGGGSCAAAIGNQITVTPTFSARPGDELALVMHGVTNPPPSTLPREDFTVQTSSELAARITRAITFDAQRTPAGLRLIRPAGGPWTAVVTTSRIGRLTPGSTITLTAPPGQSFPPAAESCGTYHNLTRAARFFNLCTVSEDLRTATYRTCCVGFDHAAGDEVAIVLPRGPAGSIKVRTASDLLDRSN